LEKCESDAENAKFIGKISTFENDRNVSFETL